MARRRGIPASEPRALRRASRRTAVVRGALALALAATLALAFLVARGEDVRYAPLVPSGTTGIVVLDLSASVYENAMGDTLRRMAREGERIGLVAFSDSAYELLPPGSPARELLPLLRYFRPDIPASPWQQFRAGTRISTGLEVAHEALRRVGRVSEGSIVLISDLEILPGEIESLGEQIALLRRDGSRIRIVPLFPTPEKRALVEQLTGPASLLRGPGRAGAVRSPEERSVRAAAPWQFVFAAALLVLLLAGNERALARLEVRP